MHLRPTARTQWGDQLQVFMDIVPVALRGSTGLYARRDSGDPGRSALSGSRVQRTGRVQARPKDGGKFAPASAGSGPRRDVGAIE